MYEGKDETSIFVSWNGDTETKKWRFLEKRASGTGATRVLGEVQRTSFETVLKVKGSVEQALAVALDAKGKVLRTTEAVTALPEVHEAEREGRRFGEYADSQHPLV